MNCTCGILPHIWPTHHRNVSPTALSPDLGRPQRVAWYERASALAGDAAGQGAGLFVARDCTTHIRGKTERVAVKVGAREQTNERTPVVILHIAQCNVSYSSHVHICLAMYTWFNQKVARSNTCPLVTVHVSYPESPMISSLFQDGAHFHGYRCFLFKKMTHK